MTFKINNVDFSGYVTRAYSVSLSPVLADAGKTLDGLRHDVKIRDVYSVTVTVKPSGATALSTLRTALSARYVSIAFDDPFTGTVKTCTMSCEGMSAAYGILYAGSPVYTAATLVFTEQ